MLTPFTFAQPRVLEVVPEPAWVSFFSFACEEMLPPFHDVSCFDLESVKSGLGVALVSFSEK